MLKLIQILYITNKDGHTGVLMLCGTRYCILLCKEKGKLILIKMEETTCPFYL